MSVDYRPYLTETDLRTAEDVLAWLEMRALSFPNWPTPEHREVGQVLAGAACDLAVRLDRERRQACRRASKECFKQARARRRGEREWAKTEVGEPGFEILTAEDIAEYAATFRAERVALVRDALSFRAAARSR